MITLTHLCILTLGIIIGVFLGVIVFAIADGLLDKDLSKPHNDYD